MKKILSAVVSAAMCFPTLASVPVGALETDMLTDQILVGDVAKSGECGDNAYWELDGSTLKITGTGATIDFVISTGTPWYRFRSLITDVVISEGITEIGGANFAGLSITSVSIPSGLTSIGRGAFSDCRYLKSVDVPETVTYIASNAFRNCSSLKEIYIRNPKCTVSGSGSTICTSDYEKSLYFDGTIYAHTGSRAESYANAYNYNFVSLGEAPVTESTTTTTTTATTSSATTTTTTSTIPKAETTTSVPGVTTATTTIRIIFSTTTESSSTITVTTTVTPSATTETTSAATETTTETSVAETTTTTVSTEPELSDEEYALRGDLNHDGAVDVTDLILCQRVLLGAQPAEYSCDVDGDGVTSVFDLVALRKIILRSM